MERRQFLNTVALTPLLSVPLGRLAAAAERWDRTLVLIELDGGNDGLNTVVPYADPQYAKLRPDIGVPRDQVLPLDERLGLNARIEPLMGFWQDHQLAVALGVGYPEPNLSHFRGIEIWNTGVDSDRFASTGWISRVYDEAGAPPEEFAADGIVIGRALAGPLLARDRRVVVLANGAESLARANKIPMAMGPAPNPALAHVMAVQENFHHAAADILERRIESVGTGAAFPETDLGGDLEVAARLLIAGVQTPVMKLSIRGFDTHAGQLGEHPVLLEELAGAVTAFAQSMKANGLWENVLLMTYSEFGRRPYENGSAGTDHGTAAPHFLLGGRVRGGLYGEQPPLDDFPDGRNLAHRLHLRSLYATAVRDWWGMDASFLHEPSLGCIT